MLLLPPLQVKMRVLAKISRKIVNYRIHRVQFAL